VLIAVAGDDPHQLVEQTAAEFGVPHDLRQFLIEEIVTARPVDGGGRLWKIERHELGKGMRNGRFPGTVEILARAVGFGERFRQALDSKNIDRFLRRRTPSVLLRYQTISLWITP
jgi:hypothetical protein